MNKTLIAKLSESTFKKLKEYKKRSGFKDKSWSEFFDFLVRNVRLTSLVPEKITRYTMEVLMPLWSENFALNLPYIREGRAINELEGMGKGKPSIVIGAGPSLKKHKHLEILAKSDFDGYVFVSDGILKKALRKGVTPDKFSNYWVGTVDGNRELIWKYYDDPLVDRYGDKIKGLFTTMAAPNARERAEKAGIEIYWYNPRYDDWRKNESFTRLCGMMTKTENRPKGIGCIKSGGNVGSALWTISFSVFNCSPICLSKDSKVITQIGVKKIKDVQVGDLVLSENGYAKVINKLYSGRRKMLKITTSSRSIRLTEDHKLKVLRLKPKRFYRLTKIGRRVVEEKIKNSKLTKSELARRLNIRRNYLHAWLSGKKGMNKDLVAEIFYQLGVEIEEMYLKDNSKRKNGRWHRFERQLEWCKANEIKKGDLIVIMRYDPTNNCKQTVGTEMAWLIGLFCGDGSARKRRNNKGYGYFYEVTFCLPEKDKEEARKKLVSLLRKWNFPFSTLKDRISVYRKKMFSLFESLGITDEKKVPSMIWKMSKEEKLAFIGGYIDADGNIEKGTEHVVLVSRNKELIEDTRILCISLGLKVENIRAEEQEGWIFNGRKWYYDKGISYSFRIQRQSALKKLRNYSEKVKKIRVENKRYTDYRFTRTVASFKLPRNLAFDVVREIKEDGEDDAYDIQMEGESFFANGILTHNCLIGIDLSYLDGTPIEKTAYYNKILKGAKGDVNLAVKYFRRIYNPYFKCYCLVDYIFDSYRKIWLDLASKVPKEFVTINCTEGGSLFGEPYIYCMKFNDFLEHYNKNLSKYFLKPDF